MVSLASTRGKSASATVIGDPPVSPPHAAVESRPAAAAVVPTPRRVRIFSAVPGINGARKTPRNLKPSSVL